MDNESIADTRVWISCVNKKNMPARQQVYAVFSRREKLSDGTKAFADCPFFARVHAGWNVTGAPAPLVDILARNDAFPVA